MRKLGMALACLWALPASAQQPLQGYWSVGVPAPGSYTGIVVIDADGRVTWDSPQDGGRPAKVRGYVAHASGGRVHIILTDGKVVTHVHCVDRADDRLACNVIRHDGSVADTAAILTRVRDKVGKITDQ